MALLTQLKARLRALFHRRQLDADMDEEMRSHVELRTRDNIEAGMSPEEARFAALRQFGWTESIKEECRERRGVRWLENLLQDIRFGARQLRKNPGFTTVAVLTLALGIGANTAIFSVVNGVLLKPLPYREPERLVTLFENHKEQGQDFVGLTAPGFTDWQAQNSVFENLAAYQVRGFDLTGGEAPSRVFGVRTSASLFPMLGVNPELGRGFDAGEDVFGHGQVAVLSHELWLERFGGNRDALGKSLTLDGNVYSVIGVMPAGFRFNGINADLWVPMAFEPWELENRGGHNYQGLGRLKPGISLAQARVEMETIAARLGRQYELSKGWGLTLMPLQQQQVGDARKPLLLLFGAVGFVLLIACCNLANLLLARAASRGREFAVRAALGAGRGRIIRQLLGESLVLALAGGLLGSLLASWIVSAVIQFGSLPRLEEIRLDWQVMAFTALLAVATGIVFGLAPAFAAAGANLNEVLKDAARGSTSGRWQRFRLGFVTAQVALAMVLLTGAGLLLHSFARLHAVDAGYRPERLLTAVVTMPDARFPGREQQRMAFLARVVERVASLPGVDSAASVMGLPLSPIGARTAFYLHGRPEPKPNEYLVAGYSQVSTNYFQTMGTPILRGRWFDSRDNTGSPYVAIVNEAFVRAYCPGEDPLGKRLRVMDSHRDQPTEIVGIVRDTRQRDLAAAPQPELYFPVAQRCWADAQIVVRTRADPAALVSTLKRAVAELDPMQTLSSLRTMESMMDSGLSARRLQMTLLASFSAAALLLAALGIYGVMASIVSQRTHEIGVRMSLGAQACQVLGMVLRQGMSLTASGIVLGLAGSLVLSRLLGSLLYEVSPADPATFVLVAVLIAGVSLIACWLPARRAARVDPLVALRNE